MTHDTPPKRIWADDDGYWSAFDPSEIRTVVGEYILTSEADALVAAALEPFRHDLQFIVDTIAEDKVYVAEKYPALFAKIQARRAEMGALGGVQVFGEIARDLLALIPQPAAAALDKLIAEAEARVRDHAAQIGGDAAVARLLRHEPDASPLKTQMTRQAIANPIRRAAKGEAK